MGVRARARARSLTCVCLGPELNINFYPSPEKIIKRKLKRRLAGTFSPAQRNNQSKMPVVKWVIKALGNQYLTFRFWNGGCDTQF